MILADMVNIGVFKRVNQRTSNPPIVEISSSVRTVRDGDGDWRDMVGVFRHTLGRKYSCQW